MGHSTRKSPAQLLQEVDGEYEARFAVLVLELLRTTFRAGRTSPGRQVRQLLAAVDGDFVRGIVFFTDKGGELTGASLGLSREVLCFPHQLELSRQLAQEVGQASDGNSWETRFQSNSGAPLHPADVWGLFFDGGALDAL